MSNATSNTAQTISSLRAKFIINERYDALQKRFSLLVEKRRADIESGRRCDARGIALSGASGTGKSCAVSHLIKKANVPQHSDAPADICIVSLRVPSPATLKFLGQMVLRSLGYNLGG